MSTSGATEAPASTDDAAAHAQDDAAVDAHGHPQPREYVRIFAILAVLTLMEVTASFVAMPRWLFYSGLVGMAVAKFALVVGFYMHLKFDSSMFRRLFVFGLALALTVFALVVTLFVFLTPDYGAAAA